ncbi:hypothetical protein K3Z97_14405, partial [Pseudomonas aeruginosa]|nr:hypothetical protein [Pseudomonas aeruginosa]
MSFITSRKGSLLLAALLVLTLLVYLLFHLLAPRVVQSTDDAYVHADFTLVAPKVAGEADLILIEGVMGLFDGNPSAADLARRFGVPVLGVINGAAMAQTFGALAYGLAHFQPDLPFSGVLGNRVGSQRHSDILRDCLPPGMRWFGGLPRSAEFELPSRHLGLVQHLFRTLTGGQLVV